MRHGYHKPKFRVGKDANEMLLRKLTVNFITKGSMVTSQKKAKAVQPFVERLVTKAKGKTEADRNYLLRIFPQIEYRSILIDQIGPALQGMQGGYTRIVKLNQRDSDGTLMTRIEWAHPVVVTIAEKKTKKTVKKEEKPAEVQKDAKVSKAKS